MDSKALKWWIAAGLGRTSNPDFVTSDAESPSMKLLICCLTRGSRTLKDSSYTVVFRKTFRKSRSWVSLSTFFLSSLTSEMRVFR